MTPVEAITAIAKLLESLVHQSRDAKTLELIKQIESPYRTLEAGYFEAKKEALKWQQDAFDANRKAAKLEDEISNQKAQVQALEAKLKKANAQASQEWLKEKSKQQAELRKRDTLYE